MKVEHEKIFYKNNFPFSARLCRITKTMPHDHLTELEFVCCLKGSVSFVASDQKNTLHEGDIHSIDYRDIHYLYSDEDNLTLIFHLDLSKLKNWDFLQNVYFACESTHCYPYQQKALEQIKDYILSFSYVHFAHNDKTGTLSKGAFRDMDSRVLTSEALKDKIEDMTATLLRYFNWFNYENQDEYMNEELYNRFHRVLSYCLEHYDSKITVSQMAAAEHINRNYFSQFLSKTIFSSFSNMVNYIRCYNAETLLLSTDMSNAEISFTCGFSDPKYFYSAFKSLWGCTPTDHRAAYIEYYSECLDEEKSTEILKDNHAAFVLRDYIAKWHLIKTLDY